MKWAQELVGVMYNDRWIIVGSGDDFYFVDIVSSTPSIFEPTWSGNNNPPEAPPQGRGVASLFINPSNVIYYVDLTNPPKWQISSLDLNAGGKWTNITCEVPKNAQPRYFANAAWVNDKIYVWGGARIQGTPDKPFAIGAFSDGYVIDPATGKVDALPDAPVERMRASAVVMDNQLVIIGGASMDASGTWSVYSTVHIYDPATTSWSSPNVSGTAPEGWAHACAALFTDKNGQKAVAWYGGWKGPTGSSNKFNGALNVLVKDKDQGWKWEPPVT
ncbi:hypothetical protein HK104_002042, partial [Borealophlyctis nickersoniae]